MKRLIVMRHAKSDWAGGQSDHDRPLNGRGRKAAPTVGAQLVERGWAPQHTACSDAERTTETWLLMAGILDGPVRFHRALYLAEPSTMLGVASAFDDAFTTGMLLAHNPGSSDLVGTLSQAFIGLKTAHAALLEVDADSWSAAVKRRDWALVAVLQPC